MAAYDQGSMFFRGQWEYCSTYDPGDVAVRAGISFVAVRQSAGENPLDAASEDYWLALGSPSAVPGLSNHNDLDGREMPDQHPLSAISGLLSALGGKVNISDINVRNRGTFPSIEALEAAYPTDEPGASAYVNDEGDMKFYLWNDDEQEWQDSGASGVFVAEVNGMTGPAVVLTASDVSAVPVSMINVPGGVPGLDANGRIPISVLPEFSIS
ncbi:MAG: hypothetical protein LBR87_08375, partial [Synergistaceae bacterium]|nr:hypothetical protein [Synergistaceae bacterium]